MQPLSFRPRGSIRSFCVRLRKRLAVLFAFAPYSVLSCGPCAEESRCEDTELHREALDEIRSDWAACGLGEAPSDQEIVSVALHFMQLEIDAGLGDEVLEELRREVDYRRWCAANEYTPATELTRGDRIA